MKSFASILVALSAATAVDPYSDDPCVVRRFFDISAAQITAQKSRCWFILGGQCLGSAYANQRTTKLKARNGSNYDIYVDDCVDGCPDVGLFIQRGVLRSEVADKTCHGMDLSGAAMRRYSLQTLASISSYVDDAYNAIMVPPADPFETTSLNELIQEMHRIHTQDENKWFKRSISEESTRWSDLTRTPKKLPLPADTETDKWTWGYVNGQDALLWLLEYNEDKPKVASARAGSHIVAVACANGA